MSIQWSCKHKRSDGFGSPLQVLEGCYKVSPELSLLQAEQAQLSQPVFIEEVLQPSDHLHGPPLDLLPQVHVLLTLGAPDLNAVLQPRIRLGCKHTLPGHGELLINQHPQVLLLRAALNPFSTQPVFVLGIALTHVQDLALGLVELYGVRIGPTSQACQGPSGWHLFPPASAPHSLVLLADLLRVHSIPLSMSLTKMLNSAGPNTDPWGTPLITGLHLDIEPLTATL
ncbi:LOW QUALITY PROTEIN: hypothetical protein QYF61_014736 [Mycteria americana]|uniref:Uncharacterized protein n=1 Tax=Mycteria americana TaxID=33587 RepID=A0AAN7NKN9_MYCAM|nr:LOW QUALITY PROTEIN: hypothetical protein QYF61_014736 [Mycteria americana]